MESQPAPITNQTFLKPAPSLKTYIRTPKRYVIAILLVLLAAGSLHAGFLSGLATVATSIGTALILDSFISRVIWKNNKHTFPDGALLTGLIIGIVLSPATSFAVSVFTAAAAILSKHVITYQKKPILNPAAFWFMALSHFIFFQSKLVGRYVSSTLVDPIPCGGRRLFGDQPRTKIPASFRLFSSIRPDPPHIGIHWLNGCFICFYYTLLECCLVSCVLYVD